MFGFIKSLFSKSNTYNVKEVYRSKELDLAELDSHFERNVKRIENDDKLDKLRNNKQIERAALDLEAYQAQANYDLEVDKLHVYNRMEIAKINQEKDELLKAIDVEQAMQEMLDLKEVYAVKHPVEIAGLQHKLECEKLQLEIAKIKSEKEMIFLEVEAKRREINRSEDYLYKMAKLNNPKSEKVQIAEALANVEDDGIKVEQSNGNFHEIPSVRTQYYDQWKTMWSDSF